MPQLPPPTTATHRCRRKGAAFKQVAALVGVSIDHVNAKLYRHLAAAAEVDERHARLAAALALCELMQEQDVETTVATYGKLFKQGRALVVCGCSLRSK